MLFIGIWIMNREYPRSQTGVFCRYTEIKPYVSLLRQYHNSRSVSVSWCGTGGPCSMPPATYGGIVSVIKRGVNRPNRDGLVRQHLRPLGSQSLQGLLVGNNADKFLTRLSCLMDGTMPQVPCNCSLTWRVTR